MGEKAFFSYFFEDLIRLQRKEVNVVELQINDQIEDIGSTKVKKTMKTLMKQKNKEFRKYFL